MHITGWFFKLRRPCAKSLSLKRFLRKSWSKRYFVLSRDKIKWYENSNVYRNQDLRGYLNFQKIHKIRIVHSLERLADVLCKDEYSTYSIEIQSNDRTLLIRTPSHDQAALWIDELRSRLSIWTTRTGMETQKELMSSKPTYRHGSAHEHVVKKIEECLETSPKYAFLHDKEDYSFLHLETLRNRSNDGRSGYILHELGSIDTTSEITETKRKKKEKVRANNKGEAQAGNNTKERLEPTQKSESGRHRARNIPSPSKEFRNNLSQKMHPGKQIESPEDRCNELWETKNSLEPLNNSNYERIPAYQSLLDSHRNSKSITEQKTVSTNWLEAHWD